MRACVTCEGSRPARVPRPAPARTINSEITLTPILSCIAIQLLTGILAIVAIVAIRRPAVGPAIYGATFLVCAVLLVLALARLTGGAPAASVVLPLGVPWIGAHFRIDALAAFFLVVIGLGGMAAAGYGIGYGRHEAAPHRVLPLFRPSWRR